jgi:hypothetical protein
VNSPRVASVETLDTGTVLEELDEIMHGDKLVIRCPPFAASQSAPATRSLPICMYIHVCVCVCVYIMHYIHYVCVCLCVYNALYVCVCVFVCI